MTNAYLYLKDIVKHPAGRMIVLHFDSVPQVILPITFQSYHISEMHLIHAHS